MPISVTIQLTTLGADTGPTFSLFSNTDNYVTAFATNVSKASLQAGYISNVVPTGTTTIKVTQTGGGTCVNETFITIT